MAGTDLVQRTQQVVATIESDEFRQRVEPLLPDTVPYRRFQQVAKTAIRSNPDLAQADDRSLFNALIRCAEAGLYPNNEDAALVPYKDKVTFIPMVDGVRKIAAEYGWDIRARVVYANDQFDYSEEPPVLQHRPVRPGMERGDRIAAYAIATHRDGRRRQRVLYIDEIEKRRSKAQTTRVWDEFPDAMWSKSAVHALFAELPRAERDLMPRLAATEELEPAQAAELLYGPDGTAFTATPALTPPEVPAQPQDAAESSPVLEESGTGGNRQQAPAGTSLPAGAPGDADDPEPGPAWATAGETLVPAGQWKDKTLTQVADDEAGREWLGWALRNQGRFNDPFYAALTAYVEGALPDVWADHTKAAA